MEALKAWWLRYQQICAEEGHAEEGGCDEEELPLPQLEQGEAADGESEPTMEAALTELIALQQEQNALI